MEAERVPIDLLAVDTSRFQVRSTEYAETIASAIETGGWREEKAGVFHLWPNGDGLMVLDGHSRLTGIARLPEGDRPTSVRALVHRGLTEAEAIELSKELNPSSAPLTPTEAARLSYEAYQQTAAVHPEWTESEILRHLHSRFAGIRPVKLRKNMVMAYLPDRVCEMVDSEELPQMIGRALGRFVRDTGVEAERVVHLANEFLRSGMHVGEFMTFLREHQSSISQAVQADMFGETVATQFAALNELRQVVADQERALRIIKIRREAFNSVRGTDARPTEEQERVLKEDRDRESELRQQVVEARHRLTRAMKFGVT